MVLGELMRAICASPTARLRSLRSASGWGATPGDAVPHEKCKLIFSVDCHHVIMVSELDAISSERTFERMQSREAILVLIRGTHAGPSSCGSVKKRAKAARWQCFL